jgi:hypothetical protein
MKNQVRRKRINKNNGSPAYQLARLKSYSNFENPLINFLDPHKYVTLKYTDIYSQSLTTVTGTNQIMRLNSIFDPDLTGTGHQPYGYDQLSALYNRYRVLSSSWKITFHAESQGFYAVVVPSNGNLGTAITNLASFTLAGETQRSEIKSQGTGANAIVFSGSINLNDLNGVTLTEYLADDRFEAQIGANPVELIVLNIGTYNPSGSTVAVDFSVEMLYHVDLHDPIALAQS